MIRIGDYHGGGAEEGELGDGHRGNYNSSIHWGREIAELLEREGFSVRTYPAYQQERRPRWPPPQVMSIDPSVKGFEGR